MSIRPVFIAFVSFLILFVHGYSSYGQLSTVGKEFWVGFMDNNRVLGGGPNNPGAPDFAVLIITANEDATGFIEYLNVSVPFSINSGQQFSIRVPSEDLDLLHRSSGVIERKGIYISSTGKVAVHAYNERFRSADGTVVLPVGALGKDYYITSHYEIMTAPVNYNANLNDESTLLVVATEDNTTVEITTSVGTLSGNPARSPFTINLNRGQSYQLKAKADLTGSRVRVVGDNADECKKIAVFGGNKWTSVGNCGEANDHLFQQAYPVNTWGTSFAHVALNGRTSGELVKVLASEDNTEVFVNGASRGSINRGEFLSLEFGINESGKIDTSKPASVTVFSKSMACNQPNSPSQLSGDPFMITYSPAEQFLTQLTFNSLNLPSITSHYVNIVVKTGEQNRTLLDGQNIGGRFFPLPGDPDLQYARVNITQGVHRLNNPSGFNAFVYGFGELESYGYAAGAALDNLNFQTETEYGFDVVGEKVACLNVEGVWDVKPDNPDFSYFVWDFGDGSDPEVGKQVPHTFSQPGVYEVTITAALSPNSCDEQEEVVFEVEVLETKAEILGEQSVCPEVEEVLYRIKGKENVAGGIFEIEGGEILQDYGDSVLVKWGAANPEALVRLIPFSPNGCPGEAIEWPVVINQRIEVTEAEGAEEICFDPSLSYFYEAPNSSSSRGYEWTVTGGQVVSGQGTSRVEVIWDQPGIEGEIEYVAFSLIDNSCEGKAPVHRVSIAPEFTARIQNVQDVACNGDNSGSIRLEISGGTGSYTYTWSHDSSLNSPNANQLLAGVYTVEIRDERGCLRTVENIEIVEPEALSVVSVSPVATSCFGKADGELELEIAGGVAPYTVDFNGQNVFSGRLSLDQLPQGTYQWEVIDANGCRIPVSFDIDSPPALQVDVRLEKPACPGGAEGELLALPAGGNGPFVFQWNTLSRSGASVDGLSAGQYDLEVTDANGCVSLGRGIVSEAAPQVRMPTGFDPRQSPGLYEGVSNCEAAFQLFIYNRWGQLIYFGNTGWDGTYQGEEVPTGTYTYRAIYSYSLEGIPENKELQGSFFLVR
ncbi:PKD domain-containing protein [Algoriphagus taiwanensis]|uniref:PKD domain-containing protein n=1 Tax=Algoriphagus taiwanensis TaxID=1445656 RepID=A0ABQ6Q637_9BACT|nr:hypothetical protein Ataiwa_27040 [Algoriphagus taiwanensis]